MKSCALSPACFPWTGRWPRTSKHSPGCLLTEQSRPIFTEQARESAVSKKLSPRLACGAIVSLVGRVANALDLRPAAWAGLFVTAVNGHAFPKCRYILGELASRFGPQRISPLCEGHASSFE